MGVNNPQFQRISPAKSRSLALDSREQGRFLSLLLWRNFSKGQFVTVVPQSFEGKKHTSRNGSPSKTLTPAKTWRRAWARICFGRLLGDWMLERLTPMNCMRSKKDREA